MPDLIACLHLAERSNRPVRGVGADLASGVLWSIPHLMAEANISKIYCVEMSQHRLLEIGPRVLMHYGVSAEKVELCLGSFYSIKLPDNSLDFIVLVTAFHHAEQPDQLLQEMYRVLKPDGVVLIVGEHKVRKKGFLWRQVIQLVKFCASYLLPRSLQQRIFGRIFPKPQPLLAPLKQPRPLPDPVLGDHYYFMSDYEEMFARNGFEMVTEVTQNLYNYFVIWPQARINQLTHIDEGYKS